MTADGRAAANSGFKKLAIQWLNEHLLFVSSVVLADSFRFQKPTNANSETVSCKAVEERKMIPELNRQGGQTKQ